jgi:hypothetical protein
MNNATKLVIWSAGAMACVIAFLVVLQTFDPVVDRTPAAADPIVIYDSALTKSEISVCSTAWGELNRVTGLFTNYSADIDSVLVEMRQFSDSNCSDVCRDYGWQRSVRVRIFVKDGDLAKAPQPSRGHTIYVDIGGGQNPGYVISKRVGRMLMGVAAAYTRDASFNFI